MTKTMNEKIYDFNEQIISYIWVIIKGGSKKKQCSVSCFLRKQVLIYKNKFQTLKITHLQAWFKHIKQLQKFSARKFQIYFKINFFFNIKFYNLQLQFKKLNLKTFKSVLFSHQVKIM